MTTKELMKTAAEHLRTLASENEELKKHAEIHDIAADIVRTMVDKEMLAVEEVLPKLAELQEKTEEELKVVEKALEFGSSSNTKLGEISDNMDVADMKPLDRFYAGVLGDVI